MNKQEFLNKYYNKNIQIHYEVVNDILDECIYKNVKLLVFGLGYDSNLWYNITNKNTYFIENNQTYIDLNKNIDKDHIIKYDYKNISVSESFNIPDDKLESYNLPNELIKLAPFDIIIIDGPMGYRNEHPGRLLPIYWSKNHLSKPGTIIYVDDSRRKLEAHCIIKYLDNKKVREFKHRDGCDKFVI